jgi:hypothetical protein
MVVAVDVPEQYVTDTIVAKKRVRPGGKSQGTVPRVGTIPPNCICIFMFTPRHMQSVTQSSNPDTAEETTISGGGGAGSKPRDHVYKEVKAELMKAIGMYCYRITMKDKTIFYLGAQEPSTTRGDTLPDGYEWDETVAIGTKALRSLAKLVALYTLVHLHGSQAGLIYPSLTACPYAQGFLIKIVQGTRG